MASSMLSESSDDEKDYRPGFGRSSFDYDEKDDRPGFGKSSFDYDDKDRSDYKESAKRQRLYEEYSENSDNFNSSFNFERDFGVDDEIVEGEKSLEEEDEEKTEENGKKNFAERMMLKMGYREGKGLGKHGQGILEPVEASNQKGRRGLGHDNKKLVEAKLKWDPSMEEVSVMEPIEWLGNNEYPIDHNVYELKQWLVIGKFKDSVEDETLFCDTEIVEQVVNSKSVFDNLDKHEMRRARARSNPYETIRGAFFLNRAAVKMANIDKACDFMFTSPKNHAENEPLFFADVCAGPGGFSEYVLWRKKWHAKGFGFTLKDSNDFKLEDFYAGSPETFHPFYGPKDDGNVYDPDNQLAFRDLIMRQTRNKGVHFMMSDGGFSVEGSENIQEILSKQLYLCQCLVALMIVRPGGNFVTKLFDLFTPFSAGLIYLMYRCFKRVSLFKPNTSRPANSERYLICHDKLDNIESVVSYLQYINSLLLKNDKNNDVLEIVPKDVIFGDSNFFQYLKTSNEVMGKKQIVGLLKIAAYTEDTNLTETRQATMRKECLDYWELPDQSRTIPRNVRPDERLETIVGNLLCKLLKLQPTTLNSENLNQIILNSPCDWFCVPCANYDKNCTLYFSMGRTKVFKLVKSTWERIEERIELPADTLIYAEMVTECRGQYRTQRKINALHIIDAWFLGCEDISHKYLPNRYELINKFCEALWKPENKEYLRVRPKLFHRLDSNIKMKFKLQECILKNGKPTLGIFPEEPYYAQSDDSSESYFFTLNNLLLLKCTVPPWLAHWSRTYGRHYIFNCKNKLSNYEDKMSESAISTFPKTFETRVIWNWPNDNSINIEYLSDIIRSKCPSH